MRLVDHGSAVANGDGVAGRIPGAPSGGRTDRRVVLATLAALLGCAAPPGTPSLHEVPERPRLAPAGERAALAEEVRSEGAAAWGEAQALRTRTGKNALPPPAWLLEPIRPAPAPAPVASRPPNPEAAIVAERVRSESDDGSLNNFLRQLVRRQPGAEAVELAADAAAEEPPGPPGRRPPPPDAPALDRFLDQLGGRLAVGRPPREGPAAGSPPPGAPVSPGAGAVPAAADPVQGAPRSPDPAAPATSPPARAVGPAPAPKPPTAGTSPARAATGPATSPTAPPASERTPAAILPPPSPGGTLPSAARAELERVVEAAHRQGAGLEVVGRGAHPALALERARAVARLLAELGPPSGGLSLRAAGPGEAVELHLVPPRRARDG